ncbi:MAG: hypothetical protein O7D30_12420, partial [Rickettsia endosymbiont of Ixodes persulcatus]|nr:hypothetical protein [Rickettsia endosymbiont of Ixodes persulcatus]
MVLLHGSLYVIPAEAGTRFRGNDKEESAIIFALGAIKGVTPNFGKLVTDERKARGTFKSITDF